MVSRVCECAGCYAINECELVGSAWLCETCRAAAATPPSVEPTTDAGEPVPDAEPVEE